MAANSEAPDGSRTDQCKSITRSEQASVNVGGKNGSRIKTRPRSVRCARLFAYSFLRAPQHVFSFFFASMSRSPPPRPPPIEISTSPRLEQRQNMKTRQRSGSLVKVEEVGARSADEILDQSAYVNYNVEWVDQKGLSITGLSV
jgi:hypothetical protein